MTFKQLVDLVDEKLKKDWSKPVEHGYIDWDQIPKLSEKEAKKMSPICHDKKKYKKLREKKDKKFINKMVEKMSKLLYDEVVIGHPPDPNEKFKGLTHLYE